MGDDHTRCGVLTHLDPGSKVIKKEDDQPKGGTKDASIVFHQIGDAFCRRRFGDIALRPAENNGESLAHTQGACCFKVRDAIACHGPLIILPLCPIRTRVAFHGETRWGDVFW